MVSKQALDALSVPTGKILGYTSSVEKVHDSLSYMDVSIAVSDDLCE